MGGCLKNYKGRFIHIDSMFLMSDSRRQLIKKYLQGRFERLQSISLYQNFTQ